MELQKRCNSMALLKKEAAPSQLTEPTTASREDNLSTMNFQMPFQMAPCGQQMDLQNMNDIGSVSYSPQIGGDHAVML